MLEHSNNMVLIDIVAKHVGHVHFVPSSLPASLGLKQPGPRRPITWLSRRAMNHRCLDDAWSHDSWVTRSRHEERNTHTLGFPMAAAAPTHAPVSSSACRSGFSSSDVSFPNFRSAAASAPGWRRREPYPAVSVVSSSPQSVAGAITVDTEVWSFPSPNEICFSLISYYLGPNLLGIGADCKPLGR